MASKFQVTEGTQFKSAAFGTIWTVTEVTGNWISFAGINNDGVTVKFGMNASELKLFIKEKTYLPL